MGELIVVILAVSMLVLYIRSLFTGKKKYGESKQQLLDAVHKSDVSSEAMMIGTKITGVMMLLFYFTYYIVTAVIIDTYWATALAGIFSVISAKNLLEIFDVLNTGEYKNTTLDFAFAKFFAIVGFAYNIYFLIFFFRSSEFDYVNLAIGFVVGLALLFFVRKK